MKTILFQGDSITDAKRLYDNDNFAGSGYANLVKAEIGFDYPNQYEFYNRGISGNRSVDVYARIKSDIINLHPDIMSILIGVNDVWHELADGNGVDADKFFTIYSMLIEEIRAAVPEVKIIILSPFVLKGSATEGAWEKFSGEVKKRAEKAEKVAVKYDLPFIPLQKYFDKALEKAPAEYWLIDGIHPKAPGHELIKRAWIDAFKNLK